MSTIKTRNRYTGRISEWAVLRRTKCTITVKRDDWATGEMVLRAKPSLGRVGWRNDAVNELYVNEYSGEVAAVPIKQA